MKLNVFYFFPCLIRRFYVFLLELFENDSLKALFKLPLQDEKKPTYICFRCGRALSDDFKICTDCLNRPVFFALDYARHAAFYGMKQKLFIDQWKFKGNRFFAISAAEKVFEIYKAKFDNLPVVPVPPRKERLRLAGFDCTDDVAFILKWCFNVKVQKPLIRIDSEEQKHKTFAGRTDKSKKRYALRQGCKINQEAVVLIDDIMTTGGTLEECAALLKSAGAKQVYALTLFYA